MAVEEVPDQGEGQQTMKTPSVIVIPGETRTEYVTRTVHEHRAPTDASVELFKEMEQAAKVKILESVNVGNTTFECVVHREYDAMSDAVVFRAIFRLNGARETAEFLVPKRKPDDTAAAHRGLRDAIASVIASRMLVDALAHGARP